jgi:hypothetical protein
VGSILLIFKGDLTFLCRALLTLIDLLEGKNLAVGSFKSDLYLGSGRR